MKRVPVVLLSIGLFGSGCMLPVPIPGRVETAPEVRGRVVDRRSRQPLEGARVNFTGPAGEARAKTVTLSNGAFVLGPEWHYYGMRVFTPCPVYYYPRPKPYAWHLEISKGGYVVKEIDLRDYPGRETNGTFVLGDVELGPVWWLNDARNPSP